MKKLNIMFLHSHITNSSGGSKFILELVKELSKNHNVILYLQKPPTLFQQEFHDAGIRIIPMSDCSTGDIKFWLTFSSQIKKQKIFLETEAQKFDVVISSIFPMNILGNSVGLPHTQHCFQPFGYFWDPILLSKLPFFQRKFLEFMRYKYGKLDIEYTKKSTIVSAPITPVCTYIEEFYGKKAVPTYAGINSSFFKPTINSDLQKKFLNKKIIIHSTDWTFTKNTNWLIDQFIEISKKIDDVVLLITEVKTSGPERDVAIKKIRKIGISNIVLCGFVPENLLPAYYSIASLGVYPGVAHKGSAAALWVIECMSCGTPVVRTNNTDEEVEHSKTGYLYDIDEPQKFQEYVIELLTNDKLNQKFGDSAREFILKNRTWEKISEIFVQNCLKSILLYKK